MWLIPRNVPAAGANPAEKANGYGGVRRIEVTVEREICSIEVHGAVLIAGRCPACGQSLSKPAVEAALEAGEQERHR